MDSVQGKLRVKVEFGGLTPVTFICLGDKVIEACSPERARLFEGLEVAGVNTRFLRADTDGGPVPFETDLVWERGNGWKSYLVIEEKSALKVKRRTRDALNKATDIKAIAACARALGV